MQINHSEYTIAEIVEKFEKDIRINREYQRGAGIWPETAKAYFIDTILEDYPFPKLFFYQIYDKAKKKPIMEVVDGQQRIQTIVDFVKDDFKLNDSSKKFSGKKYSTLDDEQREKFLMSRVQADVILSADRPVLLEMFRRINAYTAPLNYAEKRHSKYQGKFKWFITELSDKVSSIIEEFEILTTKQIIRMGDAELIAELAIILDQGIVNKSEKGIEDIYKKFDANFPDEKRWKKIITGFFDSIVASYSGLKGTHLMKPYAIHSWFAVYAHSKYGIQQGYQNLGFTTGTILKTDPKTLKELASLADAHETKDFAGKYQKYVEAATSTTTKQAQRLARSKELAKILT